jgi:YgiT-type zinc finger domain-containing protein
MKVGVCPICGGKMASKNVDVADTINGQLIIIRGVSAEVCARCGERLYSKSDMKKMERLRAKIQEDLVKPATVEEVSVFTV